METAQPWYLGNWKVDPALNRISQGKKVVRVEPKVMALLCCLAKAQGEPVPKNRLVEAVWGEVSVAEGALKHLIWETRKQLGDDAKNPRYLETVPRVGYRLLVPQSENPALEDGHGRKHRTVLAFAGLVLAGLTLVVVVATLSTRLWQGHQPGETFFTPTEHRLTGKPITSFHGLEIDPALSPEGNQVVFSRKSPQGAGFDLFVQELASSQPRQVTQMAGDEIGAKWSPDGQHLVFRHRAKGGEGSGIYMTALAQPVPKLLPFPNSVRIEDLDWSPQGSQLAVSCRNHFWGPKQIFLYEIATQQLTALTRPEHPLQGDERPVFSPDGSRLAFMRKWSDWSGDLFVYHLEEERETRLTFDHTLILGHTWQADGNTIIFSSDRLPPRALWQVATTGGEPTWMPVITKQPHNPTAARKGSPLIYQEVSCDPNLWWIDPQVGKPAPFSIHTGSTQAEYQPQVSPDGQSLAFVSERSGHAEIWILNQQDPIPQRKTKLEGPHISSFQWSPDGKEMLLALRTANRATIHRLDLHSGKLSTPRPEGVQGFLPAWSGNGQAFYFTAPINQTLQIWKYHFNGDHTEQITKTGGIMAQEHWPSGTVYYTQRQVPGLWRIQPDVDQPEQVLRDLMPVDSQNWTLTKDGVFYVRTQHLDQALMFFHFEQQTKALVSPLSFLSPYPGIGAASDGTRIFFSKVEAYESDLVMVSDENNPNHDVPALQPP